MLSLGFIVEGIWLLLGTLGEFSDMNEDVLIFPLGATMQDGGTGERSDW